MIVYAFQLGPGVATSTLWQHIIENRIPSSKHHSLTGKNKHMIRDYNSIMKRLADRGHQVDVKILDNKVSA